MKTLECGCEQLQDTGTFMSLCFDHGQHLRLREGAARLPRNAPKEAEIGNFERELILRIAPVILQRWSSITDFESTAECIFQHVDKIMRRME